MKGHWLLGMLRRAFRARLCPALVVLVTRVVACKAGFLARLARLLASLPQALWLPAYRLACIASQRRVVIQVGEAPAEYGSRRRCWRVMLAAVP